MDAPVETDGPSNPTEPPKPTVSELVIIEAKPWDYRTLPNKMLELVKNVGDMQQEGTGYFTDSESEMLTILNYLNYGEKTNITDSMIEQIDLAIKTMEGRKLANRDDDSFIKLDF